MTTISSSTFRHELSHVPLELELNLIVRDREVIEELAPVIDEEDRRDLALTALRVGSLAIRRAHGELDVHRVRQEGERLMADVRDALTTHTQQTALVVGESLRRYLDPESGSLPLRLERLVADDGDLAAVLRDALAGPESGLARTLSQQVGAQSPLMKLLDPEQAASLDRRLREIVESGVAQQRARVLAEFSLDNKDSALARLRADLTDTNGQLRREFREDLSKVVAQFSLDDKGSALSRLIERVNAGQEVLLKQLSLDSDQSALARLKNELHGCVEVLQKNQASFQNEVRETLVRLDARRRADESSPQHGDDFEVAVARQLRREVERAGDVFEAVGNTTGEVKFSKKGDFVITLGPEHAAAGRRMVIEAKADASYSDKDALAELEEAKRNRGADVALFVFARRSAGDREAFRRFGDNLIVVWDEDDPASIVYLNAALSVGRAVIVKRARPETLDEVDLAAMEAAIAEIEKQLEKLEAVHGAAETIRRQTDTIQATTKKMRDAVQKKLVELRANVECVADALAER